MAVLTETDVTARYAELDKLPNWSSQKALMMSTAEAVVHSRLASRYAVPFSSNNLTARDLMLDQLYIQQMTTRKPDTVKLLSNLLDQRIEALLSGDTVMVTDSGDVAATATGNIAWSSTQDYHPTFGMGDPMSWEVSSSMLIDENAARGHPSDEAF